MIARLAQQFHLGGVGIWALGMEGNDPAMVSALDGFAPAQKAVVPGPSSTSTSPAPAVVPATPSVGDVPVAVPSNSDAAPTSSSTTTTTTSAPASPYQYSGTFDGMSVTLTAAPPTSVTAGATPLAQSLTGFTTNDPSDGCLSAEASLEVWPDAGAPQYDVVMANQASGDCVTASFLFSSPNGGSGSGGGGGTTSTTNTTTSTIP